MSERKFLGPVLVGGVLAAGCASEPLDMPELKEMQVACVNVEGLPQYTDAGCGEVAKKVQEGFKLLNAISNGAIKEVKVTQKHYPELIEIDDAREKRCSNMNVKGGIEPVDGFVLDVAKAALKQAVDIDFSNTGMFVAVNAPLSLCTKEQPTSSSQNVKAITEECPKGAANKLAHFSSGRMVDEYGKPMTVAFGIDQMVNGKDVVAHEEAHFGRAKTRLGHEFALCSNDSSTLPNTFGSKADSFKIDGGSDKLSLMGAASHKNYLAVPHLYFLGGITKNQVVEPTRSTELTLKSAFKKEGVALVNLPLKNQAIKSITDKFLAGFNSKVNANDFSTYIGVIPAESGQERVGVYVAPKEEVNEKDLHPIILVDDLTAGQSITLEGDFELKVNSLSKGEAQIRLNIK